MSTVLDSSPSSVEEGSVGTEGPSLERPSVEGSVVDESELLLFTFSSSER